MYLHFNHYCLLPGTKNNIKPLQSYCLYARYVYLPSQFRVQSQGNQCVICTGQNGGEAGLSSRTLDIKEEIYQRMRDNRRISIYEIVSEIISGTEMRGARMA
jgi:hypothetical protein